MRRLLHVQCVQVAPVLHLHGELQRLAARARARVHHLGGRRVHQHAEELAALVLNLEPAVAEGVEREGVAAGVEDEAQRRQWGGGGGDALLGQERAQPLAVSLEAVDAHGEGAALVHRLDGALGVRAEHLAQARAEEVRHRGGDGEALLPREGLQRPGGLGEPGQGGGIRARQRRGAHHLVHALPMEDARGGQAQHVLARLVQAREVTVGVLEEEVHRALAAEQGVHPLGHGAALVGVEVLLVTEGEVQGPVGQAALVADEAVGLEACLEDEVLAQRAGGGARRLRGGGGLTAGLFRASGRAGVLLHDWRISFRASNDKSGSAPGHVQGASAASPGPQASAGADDGAGLRRAAARPRGAGRPSGWPSSPPSSDPGPPAAGPGRSAARGRR